MHTMPGIFHRSQALMCSIIPPRLSPTACIYMSAIPPRLSPHWTRCFVLQLLQETAIIRSFLCRKVGNHSRAGRSPAGHVCRQTISYTSVVRGGEGFPAPLPPGTLLATREPNVRKRTACVLRCVVFRKSSPAFYIVGFVTITPGRHRFLCDRQ